jgi:hypothetical protein
MRACLIKVDEDATLRDVKPPLHYAVERRVEVPRIDVRPLLVKVLADGAFANRLVEQVAEEIAETAAIDRRASVEFDEHCDGIGVVLHRLFREAVGQELLPHAVIDTFALRD